MSRDESDQMQVEFRQEMRDRFDRVEEMLAGKEERIRELENNQSRALGFLIAVQALGALGIWVMNKAFGAHQ